MKLKEKLNIISERGGPVRLTDSTLIVMGWHEADDGVKSWFTTYQGTVEQLRNGPSGTGLRNHLIAALKTDLEAKGLKVDSVPETGYIQARASGHGIKEGAADKEEYMAWVDLWIKVHDAFILQEGKLQTREPAPA